MLIGVDIKLFYQLNKSFESHFYSCSKKTGFKSFTKIEEKTVL